MEARCSRCGEVKPLPEFPPSKARNSGQWCRQCYREWMRERIGAVERDLVCDHCGAFFRSAFRKARFCSRPCKDRHKNRARQVAIEAAKPARTCLRCGAAMPRTMRSDARFCSDACNSAAHAVTRKIHRGAGAPGRGSHPLVSPAGEIAIRDRFRCGICGGRVSMRRKHPDPLAPSIDHIVPLALGGSNDEANLQLSHLRCNLSKGGRDTNPTLVHRSS